MAQWKKIIVSGSDAELRTLTSSVSIGVGTNQIISTNPSLTKLSGSFSGSYHGDGSNLTGITATGLNIDLFGADLTAITVAPTDLIILSDAGTDGRVTVSQLANPLTGVGLTEVSGKITLDTGSTHFTSGVKQKLDADSVVSSSAQVVSLLPTGTVSGSSQVVGILSSLNSYTSSNDTINTTQNSRLDQLSTQSGSDIGRLNNLESFSGSVDTKFSTLATYTGSNDTTNTTQNSRLDQLSTQSGSDIGRLNNLESFSGSVNTKFSTLATYTGSNDTLNTTQNSRLDQLSTASGSAIGRLNNIESFTSSINTTIKTQLDANTVISGSSQVQLASITGTTFANSLFTFPNNLVVDGDLVVNGTTVTLNTTNLLIEDRFILLNSGSANPDEGGLVIDEGAGSGHAFIYEADAGITRWGFNQSVSSTASTANTTAYAAAVVDLNNVNHADVAEYQKNGNVRVDTNGDIWIYS
jgi:hypothetical protein